MASLKGPKASGLIPKLREFGSSVDGVPRKISLFEELDQAPHSVDV